MAVRNCSFMGSLSTAVWCLGRSGSVGEGINGRYCESRKSRSVTRYCEDILTSKQTTERFQDVCVSSYMKK